MVRLPRLVIAAAASGQGKTTIAVGIMAALTRTGRTVAAAKVGPDYIDPGYHALATGRPGRNLDPWLQGEDLILPLLLHGARTPTPADLAVIEGVMGLHDGRLGTDGWASTAHIARLTDSPVVLVVDISSAARTVAAAVHGLATYDERIRIAGVILNKSGSPRHAAEVRRSVEGLGLPVLGVLPRDAGVSVPSRHLGLVPAAERPESSAALDHLAEQTAQFIDLAALEQIASSATDLDAQPWLPPTRDTAATRRVAVAGGRAFTFRYTETDEVLRALGCEPVVFDPATDTSLPSGVSGLYLGGGFPEVHAGALSRNTRLLGEIGDAIRSGLPTVAECAGLLYLCREVDDHPMVGVVPATARMHPSLVLRYREASAPVDTLVAAAGTPVRGHEFHRTRTSPGHGDPAAWLLDGDAEGWSLDPAGLGRPTLHASYLHTHWAGSPSLAARFADAVHGASTTARSAPTRIGPRTQLVVRDDLPGDPLEHHGDAEVDEALVDFAVNVIRDAPPPWLAAQLRDGIGGLAAYPRIARARAAVAARHGLPERAVLLTSGAAEAFVLLAHAVTPRRAVVVHPQFTEPEAALRRAGHEVQQVILDASDDFRLDPSLVPEDADLVVVGNPTNPTGILHPRQAIEALLAPGRVVVVDEAFMDTVVGEGDSLIGSDLDGVLVLRSLTKTWGLAGLRAGYVVGDPDLLVQLARHQPQWSVGSLAALVMQATATPAATAEAIRAGEELARFRTHLVRGLTSLGLHPVPSQAAFVLVQAGVGVREALRARGYAVRRGDTFPGLGPEWIRIAVRDPQTTDGLLRELATLVPAGERTA